MGLGSGGAYVPHGAEAARSGSAPVDRRQSGLQEGARRAAEVGHWLWTPSTHRHAFLYPAAILANCRCRFRVSRLLCGNMGGVQRILGQAGTYFLHQGAKWWTHKFVLGKESC